MGAPDRERRRDRKIRASDRRYAGHQHRRAAIQVQEVQARVRPADDHYRLSAADDGFGEERVEAAGDLGHIEIAQGAGARAPCACDSAFPAVARRGAETGPQTDALRSERVWRDRAGRRRGHVHLPRRLLQQGHRAEKCGRDHYREAEERCDRHDQSGVAAGLHAICQFSEIIILQKRTG